MKQISKLPPGKTILLFLSLLFSTTLFAQTKIPSEYFVGKWDLLFENLPQGDPRMILSLERKDGKLQGAVLDSTFKESIKFTNVEETEKNVAVYFTTQGYNVNVVITKNDDDHVTANLMGMFDAKGIRIKEYK